jgi:hypothetical protein
MSASCCQRNTPRQSTWVRRCRELGAWAFPTVILALMPKCPACVAAYVAVWTGFGLSFTTATNLRTLLLVLCLCSLLYLVLTRVGRLVVFQGLSYKLNTIQTCNMKTTKIGLPPVVS